MRPIRFVPDVTHIDFMRYRWWAYGVSILLAVVTIGSLLVAGLNLGIDFRGGILMEVRAPQALNLAQLRGQLDALELGEVTVQSIDLPTDALIRIQQPEGGEGAAAEVTRLVQETLGETYEFRRTELVGPTVGDELMWDGIVATVLAVAGIGLYVAFRFEWQFGVSALAGTLWDVWVTVGLYSVLNLEFNLNSVAALLTLAGYSVNDKVVVFDRIRENLRRRKSADLSTIINESVNQTLSRTVLTGGTTLLTVLSLMIFGGSTLFDFSLALFWGIVVGTLSSIFVAAPMLLHLPPVRRIGTAPSSAGGAGANRPTA